MTLAQIARETEAYVVAVARAQAAFIAEKHGISKGAGQLALLSVLKSVAEDVRRETLKDFAVALSQRMDALQQATESDWSLAVEQIQAELTARGIEQ